MAEAYDAAERGDYRAALAIWGPLAQAGVARAQNNVGACFAEGLGVERDPNLALRWLTLSAEAGDAVGQRNLAALYFKGEGVEQDYTARRRALPRGGRGRRRPGAGHAELDVARGRRASPLRRRRGAALGPGRRGARRRRGYDAARHDLSQRARRRSRSRRKRRRGGGKAPRAATPTVRRCWAPHIISAPGVPRDRRRGAGLVAARTRRRQRACRAVPHRPRARAVGGPNSRGRTPRRRAASPEAAP